MYRAMKAQADGFPVEGPSARTLGVRTDGPNRDIPISPLGTVSPKTGGMSVALDVALNLPKNRLPKSLGGEGRDPVFSISSAALPASLFVRVDGYPHAMIEPAFICGFEQYQENLSWTRPFWARAHD